MDHISLMNEIRDSSTLEQAFEYAFNDRKRDSYTDFFELDHARAEKQNLVSELQEELATPASYRQRPAYSYFMPKSTLAVRRMIHVNFKDLVLRYAFAMVFGRILDPFLEETCFAHRLAADPRAKFLVADYAKEGWPNFCRWQREMSESHSILLRTDISSFYDSISHEYLIEALSKELHIPSHCPVMDLFREVLKVPVITYPTHLDNNNTDPVEMRQGLPIGNASEGVFANFYLKSVDSAMVEQKIPFARYCDDMRIFSKDRAEVLNALQLLQKLLLAKGLNLNSGKTEWAQTEQEMEELISEETHPYELPEDESEPEIEPDARLPHIKEWTDRDFHEGLSAATLDQDLQEQAVIMQDEASSTQKRAAAAKAYCKVLHQQEPGTYVDMALQEVDGNASVSERVQFLQNRWDNWLSHLDPTHGLLSRTPQQVEMLGEILKKWNGSSNHAAWLLVQSAFFDQVSPKTQEKAHQVLLEVLAHSHVHSFTKGRILRHLVKERKQWRGPRKPWVMLFDDPIAYFSEPWKEAIELWLEQEDPFSQTASRPADNDQPLDTAEYDCFLFDLFAEVPEAEARRRVGILYKLFAVPAFNVTIVTMYAMTLLLARFDGMNNQEIMEELQKCVKSLPLSGASPYQNCWHYARSRFAV